MGWHGRRPNIKKITIQKPDNVGGSLGPFAIYMQVVESSRDKIYTYMVTD
jgi:hypothetical protein